MVLKPHRRLLILVLGFSSFACDGPKRSYGSDENGGGNAGVGGEGVGGEGVGGEGVGGSSSRSSGGKSSASTAGATGGTGSGGASASSSTNTAGGATSTGGVTSTATSTGGATSTTLSCGATEVECSGKCVAPTTDPSNCGVCGHDCGAFSACVSGKCQPATIMGDVSGISGMDVSVDGLFFSRAGTIQRCADLAKPCLTTPEQIGAVRSAGLVAVTKTLTTNVVAFSGLVSLSDKAASYVYVPVSSGTVLSLQGVSNGTSVYNNLIGYGGDIYFQYRGSGAAYTSYLYRAVGANAGTLDVTNRVTVGNQVAAASPVAVDEKFVYFVRNDLTDANSVLVSADRFVSNTTDASYKTLLTGTPKAIAAWGGNVYWVVNTPMQIDRRDAGATAASVQIASEVSVGEMAADGTNLYLLNSNSIQYCSLPDCEGGVKTLITGLSAASNLRIYGKFVYWIVASTSTTNGGVYRVAKP
ncbi:MAG: hypothetical protein QM784_32765 [Polyangiaceae bacterium]